MLLLVCDIRLPNGRRVCFFFHCLIKPVPLGLLAAALMPGGPDEEVVCLVLSLHIKFLCLWFDEGETANMVRHHHR
jgi:hypothetical protein